MTTSNKENGQDNPVAKAVGLTITVIVTGFLATVIIYLGIYAYKNPDPKACWVVRDLHTTAKTKQEVVARANAMGIDITEGYPQEMHRLYIAWFRWGFYTHLVYVIVSIVVAFLAMAKKSYAWTIAGFNCCIFTTNSLVWLAMGAIWRFSKAGVTASGDKLERLYGTTDQQWAASLEGAKS